jgi:hypothetical protein
LSNAHKEVELKLAATKTSPPLCWRKPSVAPST